MRSSQIYRHRMVPGVLIALIGALGAASVRADLGEGDTYSLITPNTSVYVCGTNDCAANSDLDARPADADGYALFSVYEVGPAGSGYIDPFLRFQHNEGPANGNANIETAYNTDNDNLQRANDPTPGDDFDYINQAKDTVAGGKKDPGDFNHAILFDDLLAEDGYYTFLLDINEPNSDDKSTLLLDELSFFISTSSMLSAYDPDCDTTVLVDPDTNTAGSAGCFPTMSTGPSGGDTINEGADTQKVWDMDLDAAIGSILLDNVNDGSAGSGDYDLSVKIPTSVFEAYLEAHQGQQLYVFLENTAGSANAFETNETGEVSAGFEEWAFIGGAQSTVPVPGTLLLTGLGILLLGWRIRA